jgi:uncharacterized membrane protein HdeD (DUF308 family)
VGSLEERTCHLSNNANFFDAARLRVRSGLADLNRKWGWYFVLGALLIFLGSLATGIAVTTTMLTVVVLGWILLSAGIVLVALSFVTGKWSGFLLTLAAGILRSPVSGAVAITLMVATILIAVGIFRSVASIAMQFPGWGWALLSGIVSLGLGALLLKDWQSASLWFLGLYVGIDLIIHGFSWIMFSLGVHNLANTMGITDADRRAA